ncbi:MAG: polysaccharide biosynthesis/export family protein [Verrucomicrobiales bacterium]
MNDINSDITAVRKKRPRAEFRGEAHSDRNGHSANGDHKNEHQQRNGHANGRQANQNSGGWTRGRSTRPWEESDPRKALPYANQAQGQAEDGGFKLPFDPTRLLVALKKRWYLLIFAALLAGSLFAALGSWIVKYSIPVALFRRETPGSSSYNDPNSAFKPREYSDATLYGFMKSGEVIRSVAEKAKTNPVLSKVNLTPSEIAKAVAIKPSPNPDVVGLAVSGSGNIPALVELANLYAREVVEHMKQLQSAESGEIMKYLQGKLILADRELAAATTNLLAFNKQSGVLNFEKDTEADIARLASLESKQRDIRFELDTIDLQIKSRESELAAIAPSNNQLSQAREELQNLLLQFTEKHPAVIQQKGIIAKLEKQQAQAPVEQAKPTFTANNVNSALYMQMLDLRNKKPILEKQAQDLQISIDELRNRLKGLSSEGLEYAMLKKQRESLELTRQSLAQRLRDAQSFSENALGYFKLFSEVTASSVNSKQRMMKIGAMGIAGAFLGLVLAAITLMLAEIMDTRLKTAADVSRVTNLPVLATLGDLRKMDPTDQVNWAFRTLTLLRGKLNCGPNEALVCGIISSGHGEGRSTWVNLLVSAASQRGLRVLTVDTRPTSASPAATTPTPNDPVTSALTTSVLQTPAKVTDQLNDPNSQPVVHIPLPGWVWNLERRKQWHSALDQWEKMDNLVILVELPPASQPESILLAENLPQVIWLTGSGMADAAETVTQLETLRHARCNLVGAVLNQAPPPLLNNRITRWFTKGTVAALMAGLLSLGVVEAAEKRGHNLKLKPRASGTGNVATPQQLQIDQQEEAPQLVADAATPQQTLAQLEEPTSIREEGVGAGAFGQSETTAAATNMSFTATSRAKRAPWQEKLTLGPGDVLDIYLFGNPTLTRTNIFVAPDGRLSYLQAQSVVATGLTIEELRAKLDDQLAEYYATPRTIVVPVAFNSKKYYMLGKVNSKGVYPLDRPLTLIEAVARAKGLETGLYQRSSVEMADLSRSFLIRNGEKLPINFERLFLEGDLSQNVTLEPNDYVFFASTSANEIYVLGEVGNPGPIGFVPNASIVTVLADRGGFSPRAFKKKVLVVRGSLNQPEAFAVNAEAILNAEESDFKLQPRDIIYVSARPWIKVEELLDDAAQSFIQGAVTAWTGANIGPIIKRRLLPNLKN